MENRAQNKLEYHQILFLYALENEAKRNLTNEQARERLMIVQATRTRVA